jgi:peptidoglycan/xylan/chitin deacetylase (PgdA/CDA1 family)
MRPAVQLLARAWSRLPLPVGRAVMVIGYHRVDERSDDMTVRPANFNAHMTWLDERRASFPVVSIDIVAMHAAAWPHSACVVTFDDAWADVHTYALPILAARRIPATLYVPSGLLGTSEHMTPTQVRECLAAGVSIGSHTRTHADLRRCDGAALESELRGCREDLEDLVSARITSLAYPFGHLDFRVRQAAQAAGYTTAVTTRRGWARPSGDPLRVPRNIIEDFEMPAFRAAVHGGLNVLQVAEAMRRAR